jgi:hypothetical protein
VFLPLSVKAVAFSGGWLLYLSCAFDCVWIIVGEAGIALESPDQKTRVFLFCTVLSRWFSEHACKLFGKMCERA